jgi:hypothetical protein
MSNDLEIFALVLSLVSFVGCIISVVLAWRGLRGRWF